MASIGATSKGSGLADSATTAGVNTQTSGSLFVVDVTWEGATFSSIADNKGNTYLQIGTEQSFGPGTAKARRYYVANGAGGTGHTVTVTTSGGPIYMTVFITELIGMATASPIDGTPGQNLDGASPYTASTTTSNANDILVAFCTTNSGTNPATFSESSGFTIQQSETDGSAVYTGATATRIVSATGTYTPSFTQVGDGDSAAVFVTAFKQAAGGGATDTPLAVTSSLLTLAGQDILLTAGGNVGLVVDSNTISLSGQDVALVAGSSVVIPVTNSSIQAQGQSVLFTFETPWSEGALTLTGSNVILFAAQSITLGVTEATATLTGSNVTLTADFDYTLAVGSNNVTLTGQDVQFSVGAGNVTVVVDTGALTLVGQDIGISPSFTISASGGATRRKRYRGIRRLLNIGR